MSKNSFLKDQVPDPILLNILKAHLVCESLIEEYVRYRLNRPKYLPKLTFYEKLGIAQTLSESDELDSVWESIKKLNNLRNDLAHQFTPKKFDQKLDDFLSFVEAKFSISSEKVNLNEKVSLATATLLNVFAPIALNKEIQK